jgi:hypothetical protein
MRELSVVEQRYQAVLKVISDGETVKDVAAWCGMSRQSLHSWLAKYEVGGLEALVDGSHRPKGCPHQRGSIVEVAVLELRRAHPSWGPRGSPRGGSVRGWRWRCGPMGCPNRC